jgi:hypothetical protein
VHTEDFETAKSRGLKLRCVALGDLDDHYAFAVAAQYYLTFIMKMLCLSAPGLDHSLQNVAATCQAVCLENKFFLSKSSVRASANTRIF